MVVITLKLKIRCINFIRLKTLYKKPRHEPKSLKTQYQVQNET